MKTIYQKKAFRDCLLYYLDCNYWAYEQLQWMYFKKWCERAYQQRRTVVEPRIQMKNDHLLNWFANQWEVYVEGEIAKYYGQPLMEGVFDREDVGLMIELQMENIYHIYPKTLLKMIDKSGETPQIIKSEKQKIIVE
jgi:hypothetical protein